MPLRVVLALAVVALTGCAPIEAPSLATPLPDHWRNAPALATEPAPAPTDLHSWWRAFNDEQLNALVDQALQNNLTVAQAQERLLATRVLYQHSYAPFLPSLRARTTDVIDPNASASYINAGFDATWEFGLFGRSLGTQREARGLQDAAVADLVAVRVSLVAEVVRDWIDLRSAQQREQWLSSVRDNRQQRLNHIETNARLGLASPQEVLQARADTAVAEAELSAPRQDSNTAAQQLAVLVGRSAPDPAWLTPGTLPDLGALKFTSAPAELLRTRPEIARAEADVVRMAGELGVARADMYPSLGLGASLVWAVSIASHRLQEGPDAIGGVGPLIDIPLFDWGLRASRRDSKAHELKAAVFAYRQAVLTGVAEVEIALGALEQQRLREDASVQAWQALIQSAQAEETRKRLGLSGGIEHNQALIARDQAALAVVDAKAARNIAYIRLYKALGGAPPPQTDTVAASTSTDPTGVVP